ncbi:MULTISPECIES: thiol-disulfide oxidoreductase DCC family protein [Aphanothece]|uniref:thiol-disulfide oxidoreductase DCC family protein n=1 Tax=Aphanothece TaxID=1121 RepID=UPI0039851E23
MSQPTQPSSARPPKLRILFDGACPLCRREVTFLRRRDRQRHGADARLAFIDIDAADYEPAAHAGIDYAAAMGRIHAITDDGTVLTDVEVFRQAYALIGLGWLYAPTSWPLVQPLIDGAYRLWAAARLRFTGRPSLEVLCQERCGPRLPVHPSVEA